MKIALLGSSGQLGASLKRNLDQDKSLSISEFSRKNFDFSSKESIIQAFSENSYDIVINAIAFTNVDEAENRRDECMYANATLPMLLAESIENSKAKLIHFSTDYVFDGNGSEPIKEEAIKNPINFYGYSKSVGEDLIIQKSKKAIIFRISWLYDFLHANNFPSKIIELAKNQNIVKVVSDQISTPSSCDFISTEIIRIIKEHDLGMLCKYRNIFHLSPNNFVSWYAFASKLLSQYKKQIDSDLSVKIQEISSNDLSLTASRPKFTKLNSELFEETFGKKLFSWEEDLERNLRLISAR